MISTRQLFLIISLVFFFVNRATSGNSNSSDASYEYLSDEPSGENAEVEILNTRLGELNTEEENSSTGDLYYCKLEITTAFPKAKPFENFLYALLHLNKAVFLEANTYTQAAYEYFRDLLSTVQDLDQPMLTSPQAYCGNHDRDQVEKCFSGVTHIGCRRNDSGARCVKRLYNKWIRDESIAYSVPYYGTGSYSDEDLANAISRGNALYPHTTSHQELANLLSDSKVLEVYYQLHPDRRRQIDMYQRDRDNSSYKLQEARDVERLNHSSINSFNVGVATNNYDNANEHYQRRYNRDLYAARSHCYGINSAPFYSVIDEYNRRQNLYQELGDSYGMHLYNQLKLIGRTMDLDSNESKIFKNPAEFCQIFLSNNPYYYQ